MDGFWESFSKWFSEKTGTPLYFTYIGFFLAWNWKFFDVLLLENKSVLGAPAIEYINSHLYFSAENFLTWFPAWVTTLVNWTLNFGWHVIPPAAFTFVAIMYFPAIQIWALDKYLDSRFDRKKIFTTKQRQYEEWLLGQTKKTEKIVDETVAVKKRVIQKKESIEKATTKEEQWSYDYETLKGNPVFSKFKQIYESIYSNGGSTVKWSGGRAYRVIDADVLALAHSTGLINIDGTGSDEKIELTEKGKYFVSQFLSTGIPT